MNDKVMENMENRIVETVNDSRILESNRMTLSEFIDTKQAKSCHTREFYAYRLRELSNFCNKPFKKMTRKDITLFLSHKGKTKIRTINGYIATFKAFFRWLYKLPRYQFPECVIWLEKTKPEPAIKNRHELPTMDEFKQLLNATRDPRVKCYLTMSLEGIYRKSELRLMCIKDLIVKDKYVMAYSYEKKTHSMNYKPLVFSKPYIIAWLNAHPFKDDPESPLFISMTPPKKKFLGDTTLNLWIRRLAKNTGIKKRITPHRFRHMRTTLMLLSGMDKELVRSLGGWTTNQMMNSTYSHVSKEDTANTILNSYGIETETDGAGDIQITKCIICGHQVSELEDYCPNCKNPPNLSQVEKEQKKLLVHQKDEKENVEELKSRMNKMERYVQEKLVEEIVRAVIKHTEKIANE